MHVKRDRRRAKNTSDFLFSFLQKGFVEEIEMIETTTETEDDSKAKQKTSTMKKRAMDTTESTVHQIEDEN